MRIRAGFVVILSLALATSACGGAAEGGSGGGGGTVTLSDGQSATDRGSASVSGDTARIEVGDFYFSPTILSGPAGQEVTLTLESVSQALHNFQISDQGIDEDIEPGGRITVTVTFPDSGAVTFECKYHLAQNMRGELRAS
jgi:plastocyanin